MTADGLRLVAGAVCILLLIAASLSAGEGLTEFRFRHYSVRNGLSQSSVACVIQDRRGFMWFGTEDGLNRFDGVEFRIFKTEVEDPRSINVSIISVVFEDSKGRLWIGTRGGGLSLYDCTTDSFTAFKPMENDPHRLSDLNVNDIVEDHEGYLWITGHRAVSRMNPDTGKRIRFLPDPDDPDAIAATGGNGLLLDTEGRIWISFSGGRMDRYDPSKKRFDHFVLPLERENGKSEEIGAAIQLKNGDLLFGSSYGNMYLVNPDTGATAAMPGHIAELDRQAGIAIQCFYEMNSGRILIGTDRIGVVDLNPETGTYRIMQHNPHDISSIISNSVYHIYRDRSGLLWFTTSRGISVFDTRISRFENFSNDPFDQSSLLGASVLSLAEDRDGTLWVGTDTGGLNRLDPGTTSFRHYLPNPDDPRSIHDQFIRCILVDRDNALWLGSTRRGLLKFDKNKGAIRTWRMGPTAGKYLSYDFVRCLMQDSDGNIWVGTGNGLNRIDPDSGNVKWFMGDESKREGLSSNRITGIIEDRKGYLWISTMRGLNRMDRKDFSIVNFFHSDDGPNSLTNDRVYSVFEDSRGNIWAGTIAGLNRVDPHTFTVTRFTNRQGLPNNVINAILQDGEGYIWFSTNLGLSRLNPDDGSLVNYMYDDGLQDNEFNLGVRLKDSRGRLLFGGIAGFNRFDPLNLTSSDYVAPVSIISISTRTEKFTSLCTSATVDKLELQPGSMQLTVEFASLDYRSPEKNLYRYRMQNFDQNWIENGNRRFATYTNIPPGEYVMQVQASSSDGVWNEAGAQVRLVVLPAMWETYWFRTLAAMFAIGIIIAFVRWRRLKAEHRARELERQVAEKTHELQLKSQEQEAFNYSVSHDLRAPLWRIHNYSELMLEEYGERIDPEGKRRLSRIKEISDEMTELITNLLSLSRAGRKELAIDRVDLSRMVTDAVDTLHEREPERRIESSIEANLIASCDEALMTIAINNLVENALKYAAGREMTRIEFGQKTVNGGRAYYLRDNGAGFSMDDAERIFEPFVRATLDHTIKGSGIGLATVHRIIERHNGRIWAEAQESEGATFWFTLG